MIAASRVERVFQKSVVSIQMLDSTVDLCPTLKKPEGVVDVAGR
jgi:hypothetical protein